MKINVAVFFGGKSVEHEISVISAVQAINYFDEDKYNVFPIYITKDNLFFYSDAYKDIANFRDLNAAQKLGVQVTFESSKTHYGTPKAHLVPVQTTPSGPSKRSARGKNDYGIIDVGLPITHGSNVEDGTVSGLLELLNIPYSGSSVFSSALCMDKWASKLALQAAGIPLLPGVKLSSAGQSGSDSVALRMESYLEAIRSANINFPIIVKPVNLGSSVGISLASNEAELEDALELAFTFAKDVLVEPAVQNLREVNCSVLGNEDDVSVSSIEEVFKQDDILSFDDKYLGSSSGGSGAKGGKFAGATNKMGAGLAEASKFAAAATAPASFSAQAKVPPSKSAQSSESGAKSGMASLARKVPADVSDTLRAEVQSIAARAFQELRCNGVVRFDFLIDVNTSKVYLNEVNTIPGSLAFYLWEASGIPYPKLLERLVSIAFQRARDQEDMVFSFETNVLANAAV